MKTHPRLLALILVIALLAACAPAPTPIAIPTATFTPPPTVTPVPRFTRTPTPTEIVVPTATATVEATKMVQTLFKSEKYTWFGGFDMTEAKIDSGSFVFKDEESVNFIIEKFIKAYAIQKGMSESNFLVYLERNDYKIPVLGFESDASAPSVLTLKEEVLDLKKPIKITLLEEMPWEDGSLLATGATQSYGKLWYGMRIEDNALELIQSKEKTRWTMDYSPAKWAGVAGALRLYAQLISSLPRLNNYNGENFFVDVYKSYMGDSGATIPQTFTFEEFWPGGFEPENMKANSPIQFVPNQ